MIYVVHTFKYKKEATLCKSAEFILILNFLYIGAMTLEEMNVEML